VPRDALPVFQAGVARACTEFALKADHVELGAKSVPAKGGGGDRALCIPTAARFGGCSPPTVAGVPRALPSLWSPAPPRRHTARTRRCTASRQARRQACLHGDKRYFPGTPRWLPRTGRLGLWMWHTILLASDNACPRFGCRLTVEVGRLLNATDTTYCSTPRPKARRRRFRRFCRRLSDQPRKRSQRKPLNCCLHSASPVAFTARHGISSFSAARHGTRCGVQCGISAHSAVSDDPVFGGLLNRGQLPPLAAAPDIHHRSSVGHPDACRLLRWTGK
jgi:hypothetical protein